MSLSYNSNLSDPIRARLTPPRLPASDNTPEGLAALKAANGFYRNSVWPSPYDRTEHQLHLGDARDLSWIPNKSVHLVVTSPPYWTLKKYEDRTGQLAEVAEYEAFLDELDKVWRECERVLVEGGRVCCVVGDVCVPRRRNGRHHVMPLHADIQVAARTMGLDCLMAQDRQRRDRSRGQWCRLLWQAISTGCSHQE